MRVAAGRFKGRRLTAPKGSKTRPTASRVRTVIFDILQHAPWAHGLAGYRVMDVYAGSGALGVEALSREAEYCLFIEAAQDAVAAIAGNLEALGLGDAADIRRCAAHHIGMRDAQTAPFDLVFLDPPYGQTCDEALGALADGAWLVDDALIVVEQALSAAWSPPAGYVRIAARRCGPAHISFLSHDR